jgi:hypothetical protein
MFLFLDFFCFAVFGVELFFYVLPRVCDGFVLRQLSAERHPSLVVELSPWGAQNRSN